MKKVADWKSIGTLVATLQELHMTMRDTLSPLGVGIEIFPWLASDGKKFFVEALKQLGKDFLTSQRVRVLSRNVIEVNLDASLKIPEGHTAVVVGVASSGWVKVELVGDQLIIGGRKVFELDTGKGMRDAFMIRDYPLSKNLLHPNLIQALIAHQRFIPEKYKSSKVSLFFCGAYFPAGDYPTLYRYMVKRKGVWEENIFMTEDWFDDSCIVLALEDEMR